MKTSHQQTCLTANTTSQPLAFDVRRSTFDGQTL
jgi:hypothetical protein